MIYGAFAFALSVTARRRERAARRVDRVLRGERCAARSCPAIPCEAEAREAEQQHRPSGGFGDVGWWWGDGVANSHHLCGVINAIGVAP
jgi:hypothetical protein